MKIGLVFPKSTFLIDPMVYPPLGLWYLASQIEAQGHETDFFDLSTMALPEDGEFDQIWISATSAQIAQVRLIERRVKNWTRTTTILGGPLAIARPREFPYFDMVYVGEADHPNVVKALLRETLPLNTPQWFPNLDFVIPPTRRWSHLYHAYLNGERTTTMFTSRGCPNSCAFCESGRKGKMWGNRVRFEPLEVVKHQIAEIEALGFGAIMFYDDILPINKPRTYEIMESLKEHHMLWRCFLRTDIIERHGGYEYLKAMHDSGLVEVLAGVESASNVIKNNVGKGTTIEQDTNALQQCQKLGIAFKASIILGLPGETRETMETTRDWILKNRPDRADVNILIPFPGTPIMDHPNEYDVEWEEELPEEFWYKGPRDESIAIVRTSELSAQEIKDFRDELIEDLEREGVPY